MGAQTTLRQSLVGCIALAALLGVGFVLFRENSIPFLPPLLALGLLLVTRSAIFALSCASIVASALHAKSVLEGISTWFSDHLIGSLASSWHLSALVFTLQLAAFAAILEHSGAISHLLKRWVGKGRASSRFQLSIMGLGLLCFFDGLANALMLGRVGRKLADQVGVSREKLAYLVDTTSSAVACIAFLSTWSVFQLTQIHDGLADSSIQTPAYQIFLQSIPLNFYCLTSLVLAALAAFWNWNPPPMNQRKARSLETPPTQEENSEDFSLLAALGPIAALILSVPFAFWILGRPDSLWPSSWKDIQVAFSTSKGPQALVLAGFISIAAALLWSPGPRKAAFPAMLSGVRSVLPALAVLALAWTLGSTLSALETGPALANLIGDQLSPAFLPLAIFITASLVAFSTGTSWGTMSLLMPLALATLFSLPETNTLSPDALQTIVAATVAAVFGGAVFGDHSSPFSDTTIVSALACGVSTTSHVATQLPYALVASFTSILFGYLPFALGAPPLVTTLASITIIVVIVTLTRARFAQH